MADSTPKDQGAAGYVSKKCHSCYTYVPLEADVCPYCQAGLGKVGKHGMADKVTDWKAYLSFAVAFVIFIIFILYAFF
ncbi:MAG: hypothetical protein PVJ84_00845 [Desulfobacteraceae bacterium]|jgi:hypothetical protein